MEQHDIYVGIDVAKARVDVAIRPGGDTSEVSNDEAGIATLVAQMQQLNPVLEASGGLELPLVAALAAASLPVVVVNPRPGAGLCQGHWEAGQDRFPGCGGPSSLRRGRSSSPASLRDADTQTLNSLVARRQQVVTMLVAERNRLSSDAVTVRPSIEAHIAWLKQELDDLWTRAYGRPSARVLYGGRRTTCCAAYPASETRSLLPFWHTCPNWGLSTADRSPP